MSPIKNSFIDVGWFCMVVLESFSSAILKYVGLLSPVLQEGNCSFRQLLKILFKDWMKRHLFPLCEEYEKPCSKMMLSCVSLAIMPPYPYKKWGWKVVKVSSDSICNIEDGKEVLEGALRRLINQQIFTVQYLVQRIIL